MNVERSPSSSSLNQRRKSEGKIVPYYIADCLAIDPGELRSKYIGNSPKTTKINSTVKTNTSKNNKLVDPCGWKLILNAAQQCVTGGDDDIGNSPIATSSSRGNYSFHNNTKRKHLQPKSNRENDDVIQRKIASSFSSSVLQKIDRTNSLLIEEEKADNSSQSPTTTTITPNHDATPLNIDAKPYNIIEQSPSPNTVIMNPQPLSSIELPEIEKKSYGKNDDKNMHQNSNSSSDTEKNDDSVKLSRRSRILSRMVKKIRKRQQNTDSNENDTKDIGNSESSSQLEPTGDDNDKGKMNKQEVDFRKATQRRESPMTRKPRKPKSSSTASAKIVLSESASSTTTIKPFQMTISSESKHDSIHVKICEKNKLSSGNNSNIIAIHSLPSQISASSSKISHVSSSGSSRRSRRDKSNSMNNVNDNREREKSTSYSYHLQNDFSRKALSFAQESTIPKNAQNSFSTPQRQPSSPHHHQSMTMSWEALSGKSFHVRSGPDYPKNKRKAPSERSMYNTACVRIFKSNHRTKTISRMLPLPLDDIPTIVFDKSQYAKDPNNVIYIPDELTYVPHVFILHFEIPFETPSMFKAKNDGIGSEIVYYLVPSRKTIQELVSSSNNHSTMSPSTRLFLKWCRECESSIEMRSRFKCMANVLDLSKHNISWMKPYNGKPVLITESGSVHRGSFRNIRYLEMSANVHEWAFIAKKGVVTLLPKLKDMQIDFAFTIEGRLKEEMPECILGASRMNYVDQNNMIDISMLLDGEIET